MDADTYRTVMQNWAARVEECERAAGQIAKRASITSWEYRRAKALEAGYRAAIQAAYDSMQKR